MVMMMISASSPIWDKIRAVHTHLKNVGL